MALEASPSPPYRIEVCSIPLSDIVMPEFRPMLLFFNLQHIFIRGNARGVITALNFQPADWREFTKGKAIITKQNYDNSLCEAIFVTDQSDEYEKKWHQIERAYEEASKKYAYSIFEKNCASLTKEILKDLGYNDLKNINLSSFL